jgi:Putative peptidoglycan binding domain
MRYKITMKTLLALTCCLALTAVVRAEDQDNNKNKKEKKTEQAVTTSGHGAVNVDHGKKYQTLNSSSQTQFQGKQKLYTPNNFRATNTDVHVEQGKHKWQGPVTTNGRNNLPAVQSNTHLQTNKSWHTQKFTLQKNSGIQGVRFQGTTHIAGSQNWQGNNYNAFRIYTSQRHDRGWWSSRYNRIGLFGGGYYYWDNGYWYPAWGYDPGYEFYAYDGPIYGYDGLPPDQVIANVQSALQQQGYYHGIVDGMLGPLTRAALAQYQADHGLYPTSAIDEPTLQTLGMV